MAEGVNVFDYDSIDDLESTIDEVYDRVNLLKRNMDVLEDEVEGFLNYEHDPDVLRGVAEYVETNIQHEALASIAFEHTQKELENPEHADNWEKLEETADKASGLVDTYKESYQTLWNEFGYEGEVLDERISGVAPFRTFIHEWENKPYNLFSRQERLSYHKSIFDDVEPTMARQFDIREKEKTGKHKADIRRGEELEEKEKEPMDHQDHILREVFSGEIRDAPGSHSRWLNHELLFLQNTLEDNFEQI